MEIEKFLSSTGWDIVAKLSTPPREARYHQVTDLPISPASLKFMETYKQGIYLHQKEAIRLSLKGENVCMTTGTASGKTLAFQVTAIEHIVKNPYARVIAIYPMKALGREQEKRWVNALEQAGINVKVGRIDGNVPYNIRPRILSNSQVLIFTPDIIHAWLLSNLSNRDILSFLQKVSLIVVDEVHTYSGVFGSNAAFLFRRLQHLLAIFAISPQIFCASATIANTQKHLKNLFGQDFSVIDREMDTSPKHQIDIYLTNPPGESDFITEVVRLLAPLYEQTGSRFITFVDSRKQVELITSIIGRNSKPESDESTESNTIILNIDDNEVVDEALPLRDEVMGVLERINVLPYRAGYEPQDRERIQERLTQGKLSGVVSTSALELGIDIPHLETCVLVGVPPSSTSLQQRIGRIGRHSKGNVIAINSGDVYDQAVFSNPKSILERPLAESALYLGNEYIQYIHALCLARLGGEHDQVTSDMISKSTSDFSSQVSWPDKFIWLCGQERSGQIPKELQSMKAEAGDNPNYTFPLRDVQSQFKVEHRLGPNRESKGSMTYGQLMREAYPGAVYYYATLPYRVTRVGVNSKIVEVRKEKRYTTKPRFLPTMIFPNLSQENIFQSFCQGELVYFESNLQVRESINGIKERRGPNETIYNYPLPVSLGFYFDLPLFTRNYFSTGVVITHPAINREGVDSHAIAELTYEAFFLLIPFERQDINYAVDKFRLKVKPIEEGHKFIAIYDQTYGSLRLTSRIMEKGILRDVLIEARKLADKQELIEVNQPTMTAIEELINSTTYPIRSMVFGIDIDKKLENNYIRVIIPNSKGLLITLGNEEFRVIKVFYTPDGLRYEGVTPSLDKSGNVLLPLIEHVIEIPGESKIGLYNLVTGKVEEIVTESERAESIPVPIRKPIDTEKLRIVLTGYFDETDLDFLCRKIGTSYQVLGEGNKAERVRALIAYSEKVGMTTLLLREAFALYKRQQSIPP